MAAFLVPTAYLLYGYHLHPAWRRERRVLRACEKAFGDEEYRLVRLRLRPDGPSGADLFSAGVFGTSDATRYFTYVIETEADPDFSGMRQREIALVRHYMGRSASMPHHGREVLRPE